MIWECLLRRENTPSETPPIFHATGTTCCLEVPTERIIGLRSLVLLQRTLRGSFIKSSFVTETTLNAFERGSWGKQRSTWVSHTEGWRKSVSSLIQFRRDLGFVCESHHLNDLGDVKKYKPSQPYGNSDSETANLQYAAVLLRTADLLHVTSDRTPSIAFRIINPTDPISQQEWAKQMAVKRVRPKLGLNVDGIPDEKAPRDTIEVHAYFTKEDGFFGLTSYLAYAAEQLKKSHEWIATTAKLKLAPHDFPWRRIDDSNIETEGFI